MALAARRGLFDGCPASDGEEADEDEDAELELELEEDELEAREQAE